MQPRHQILTFPVFNKKKRKRNKGLPHSVLHKLQELFQLAQAVQFKLVDINIRKICASQNQFSQTLKWKEFIDGFQLVQRIVAGIRC